MVIVEPDRSSRLADALRASSLRRASSAALSHRSRASTWRTHRHHQAVRRLRCDPDVHRAVLADDAGLVVKMRIHHRLLAHGFVQRLDQKRQDRQSRPRAVTGALRVEGFAQFFKIGHVDFVDVGDVRDAAGRQGHALGNLAPQADHLDFRRRGCRGRGAVVARRGARRA